MRNSHYKTRYDVHLSGGFVNHLLKWASRAALLVGVLTIAAPASAQSLSLGYQFQRFWGDGDGLNVPLGFNVDAGAPLGRGIEAVGQLDWSRKNESTTIVGTSIDATANFTTFGGGIRWHRATRAPAAPFVDAMIGATRLTAGCKVGGVDCEELAGENIDAETDPMFQVGGGVTFPVGGFAALAQVDYRRIMGDADVNSFRFVVGVRFER
jgi:hypothetical protein